MNDIRNEKKSHSGRITGFISILVIVAAVILSAYGVTSFSRNRAAETYERDLSKEFSNVLNDFKSLSLSGIYSVPKVYTISDAAVAAPKPSEQNFGTTDNADEIEIVINKAKQNGLSKGSDFIWNRDITPYKGGFQYYSDETICAILWKEQINGCLYNFAEVCVAHPSQFRRMLNDDTFGSNNLKTTSSISKSVNAVVGMSGDFYGYRKKGVVVYHSKLFRSSGKGFETCYVDNEGNLLFDYEEGGRTEDEITKYIKDNNIAFSLCFGPVLVDNGQLHDRARSEYTVGEILDKYSRAALGQVGKLHYLYCTVDSTGTSAIKVGEEMLNKGCDKVYNLDGGQTATIYHHGKVFNRVSYGNERPVSDIIYFATAKPETEGAESDEL